jgi:hypothetical protein
MIAGEVASMSNQSSVISSAKVGYVSLFFDHFPEPYALEQSKTRSRKIVQHLLRHITEGRVPGDATALAGAAEIGNFGNSNSENYPTNPSPA